MIQQPTILLLIPHLGGGGAERIMAQLASSLSRDRFAVHLGVMTCPKSGTETLPPGVLVHEIGAHRVLFSALGLLAMVRRLKPDLILCGMFHLSFLVLLLRPLFPHRTRVLIRQNGMLSQSFALKHSGLIRRLYHATYPKADGIVCQTDAMAAEMADLVGSRSKIHVLRNPVDVNGIRTKVACATSPWGGNGPHLLAMGRLSGEKGFDLLLEAFAVVLRRYPTADLVILGQGIEEKRLLDQREKLGLRACVRFPGYAAEPTSWFRGANLFVIPSRHDAFPNVLLEAASVGLPIVMTPCSPGITGFFRGQPGLWLSPEISSNVLADSILDALQTLERAQRFEHRWLDPYDLRDAIPAYEALIQRTLSSQAQ